LIDNGVLSATTGVEVGKMAYGTGDHPFIRTTDIAELEIKADPRQGVSKDVYDMFSSKASIAEGDVVVVRDGSYLVGSSAIATAGDVPALICGGIYRLRSRDRSALPEHVLLGLLNPPLVRKQMRARQFTRDVIDTLGQRLFEVRIPDPASAFATNLGALLQTQMQRKATLKFRMSEAIALTEPHVPVGRRNRPGWSMSG
jgi:hypothetical protein